MSKTLRCNPELLKKDLSGRTYVVTGANSGIGLTTTQQLVEQGAHVIMGCRRISAGEEAAAPFREARGSYEVVALDLAKPDSVRAFADTVKARHTSLHGLVNNAGIMGGDLERTEDGYEMQFATNHLGHVLLTELLLEPLESGAPSRIVNVSSCFHVDARGRKGEIDLDDLHFQTRPYDPWTAYAQSKLANVLHAKELARRLEGTGVTAYSVHPGWVRSNLISRSMPSWLQNIVMRPLSPIIGLIGPEDGAQSSLHCLLADDATDHNGGYFSQKGIYPDKAARAGGWPLRSPNPQAHDVQLARRLHDASLEAVGLT